METFCPLCRCRISDWWQSSGKTTKIEEKVVHNYCLQDLEMKYGKLTLAEIKVKMTEAEHDQNVFQLPHLWHSHPS